MVTNVTERVVGTLKDKGRRLRVGARLSDPTVRPHERFVCVDVHGFRPRSPHGSVMCEPSRRPASCLLWEMGGGEWGLSERNAGRPGRGGVTQGGGVSSSPSSGWWL